MSKAKKRGSIITAKDAAAMAAGAGAAAGSAILLPPSAPPALLGLAATVVAIFPPLVALMTEAGFRRMRARGDRFLETIVNTWARDENMTHEEVAGLLEAHKDDPDVADAVWRAVRALMEAPNDAAAVPLGVLVAEYARDKRGVDNFFRGTVRLIAELSARELSELLQLFEWVLRETKRDRIGLRATPLSGSPGSWRVDLVRDDIGDLDPDLPDARLYSDVLSGPERLFRLLELNDLAYPSRPIGLGAALPELGLTRDITERLWRILSTSTS